MSQENVRVVRRLYETAHKRGWDAAIASPDVHDDFEPTFPQACIYPSGP
jgi:hypothetical protein